MSASGENDPLLEELDEARRRIFERCDNDPEKVFEYFMEYQKQFADRLISNRDREPKGDPAA